MSKTLPDYNSLVRWTVNDVCLWLMENGFSTFVRHFRESGVDGSRLAELNNTELQRMRCPFNKQGELLRCVKAIERKEPSRPQGVQNIVNRPPPRQPDPPKKDYTSPPPVPENGYDSDEGSGPDDDYMWPQSDFSDSDDQDYENETANDLHQTEPMSNQGHHHRHHPSSAVPVPGHHLGHHQSPAAPVPDRNHLNPPPPPRDNVEQPHLIEEDVYDAPYEETEGTTTRTPSRSTSHSIVDKLKYELSKRSRTEEVPSEDSDSEGSYEEPAGPPGKTGPPGHGHRPPPPLPTQHKPVPVTTARRAPPAPKEEEQLVYEEVEETETTPQKPTKPQIMNRRPPAETPHIKETQDVYDDPDNPTVTPQLPVPSVRPQHTSPSVPRRQPPPIPVQSQNSIPDHRAPPLPPNAKSKSKLPPPPAEEIQDVYEIPNAGEAEQPAYIDMQKPQKQEEEQGFYELPEQDDKSPQKPAPKSKVTGGVSMIPGITASLLKKGPMKEDKPAPSRPLPTKPTSESTPPPPKTKSDKHIPVPKPPGKKDAAVSRPLPTPPTPDDKSAHEEDASGEENISSFPWYHQIERKDADRKLKEHGTTGVFLIRNSSKANQPYTLALLYENNVFNLPIRQRDDNKYAMGNPKKHEQGFDKVSQLVEFFSSHTLILSGTTTGVRLKIPLPK